MEHLQDVVQINLARLFGFFFWGSFGSFRGSFLPRLFLLLFLQSQKHVKPVPHRGGDLDLFHLAHLGGRKREAEAVALFPWDDMGDEVLGSLARYRAVHHDDIGTTRVQGFKKEEEEK